MAIIDVNIILLFAVLCVPTVKRLQKHIYKKSFESVFLHVPITTLRITDL